MRIAFVLVIFLFAISPLSADPTPGTQFWVTAGPNDGGVKLRRVDIYYSSDQVPHERYSYVPEVYRAKIVDEKPTDIRLLTPGYLVLYQSYTIDPCVEAGDYEYLVPSSYMCNDDWYIYNNYQPITIIGAQLCSDNGLLTDLTPQEYDSYKVLGYTGTYDCYDDTDNNKYADVDVLHDPVDADTVKDSEATADYDEALVDTDVVPDVDTVKKDGTDNGGCSLLFI